MRIAARFAAWVAGMVLFSGGFGLAIGDEPNGQDSKCTDKACQEKQCQYHSTGVPILSKIPYVSRLFKTVGIVDGPGFESGQCPKTPCAEELERIGIDFELCPACPDSPVMRFGRIGLAICADDEACECSGKEC